MKRSKLPKGKERAAQAEPPMVERMDSSTCSGNRSGHNASPALRVRRRQEVRRARPPVENLSSRSAMAGSESTVHSFACSLSSVPARSSACQRVCTSTTAPSGVKRV
jgi:hypothetical protein